MGHGRVEQAERREEDAGSVHPSVYLDSSDHEITGGQPLPPAYEDLPPRKPAENSDYGYHN